MWQSRNACEFKEDIVSLAISESVGMLVLVAMFRLDQKCGMIGNTSVYQGYSKTQHFAL